MNFWRSRITLLVLISYASVLLGCVSCICWDGCVFQFYVVEFLVSCLLLRAQSPILLKKEKTLCPNSINCIRLVLYMRLLKGHLFTLGLHSYYKRVSSLCIRSHCWPQGALQPGGHADFHSLHRPPPPPDCAPKGSNNTSPEVSPNCIREWEKQTEHCILQWRRKTKIWKDTFQSQIFQTLPSSFPPHGREEAEKTE
jgi:hypothetical protein